MCNAAKGSKMATGRLWGEEAAKQEVTGTLGRSKDTDQHPRVKVLFPRTLVLETSVSLMGPHHRSYQI